MTFSQSRDDGFLVRLREIIEANLTNAQFGVTDLASEMGMSRSNLHRKIQSRAGTSVSKYICQIRLVRAVELLKQSSATISEIAFDCGFRSVSYFTKCFHDFYGYPPGKVRTSELKGHDPDNRLQQREKMGKGKKRIPLWLFTSATLSLIAVIVILLLFMPFTAREDELEKYAEQPTTKSIAVLPFINDSPGASDMTFINGTMEAILNNLGRIEALDVVSRTSVEQYRGNPKPIPEIAEALGVSYILEGSGQKYGDSIQLTIQLLDAIDDRHIWSEQFKREIISAKELFALQSNIAQLVAAEIEVRITPEEKQRIENIPTSSMIAYEFWQKAREEFGKYNDDKLNQISIQKAEDLYRYALEYDPAFAWPYVGIANIYLSKHHQDLDLSRNYLDSARVNLERALSYDTLYAGAYHLRAYYHNTTGENDKAIQDFQKTLELSPNEFKAREGLGWLCHKENDFIGALENFHKVALVERGENLPTTLRYLGYTYFVAGFKSHSDYYHKQALDLDGDSVKYYIELANSELYIENDIEKAAELFMRAYKLDSSDFNTLKGLSTVYLDKGHYAEALRYTEKKIERLEALGEKDLYSSMINGLVFLMNGNREKAEYHFDQQIKYQRLYSSQKNRIAMSYASLGDREQAYNSLIAFNEMESMQVYVQRNFRDDYFFKSIQDEPEFIKIRSELIGKYQAEHERVRLWLEENDMLNITHTSPPM